MVSGMELGEQMKNDFSFLLSVGEIFTLIAYGQLVIESAAISKIDDDLLNQIFDFMVRDFSRYATDLYGQSASNEAQQAACLKMINKPVVNEAQFEKVLREEVYTLADVYTMNE